MSTLERSFTARQVPWAKLGAVIDDPDVRAADAAKLGGLDFEVELRRTSFESPDGWRIVDSRVAVVRVDTSEFFSFVSTRYRPVQYAEAFAFIDEVNPRYVAAGVLSGGRQGFMVVQLPGHEDFDPTPNDASDPHQLYVVLRTSHDLSKGVEVALLPLRGLCMNQLALPSLTRNAPQSWSFAHVGDPLRKLREAELVARRVPLYTEVFANRVRQLASVRVATDELTVVLKRVIPDRPRRQEHLNAITSRFRESALVGFAGTGWGAVNAVSDYFEHGRTTNSRTDQSRFTGGLAGETRKYVARTAQLLLAR